MVQKLMVVHSSNSTLYTHIKDSGAFKPQSGEESSSSDDNSHTYIHM